MNKCGHKMLRPLKEEEMGCREAEQKKREERDGW